MFLTFQHGSHKIISKIRLTTKNTFEMDSSTDDVSDSVGAKNIRQEASHATEDTSCPANALQIEHNSEEESKRVETSSFGEDLSQFCRKQTSIRNVDAYYVANMEEYETGDTVVWSALDCIRAFHRSEECILPFLAREKACP
jgi:hypothetical protein